VLLLHRKPAGRKLISRGFLFLEPQVFEYLEDDSMYGNEPQSDWPRMGFQRPIGTWWQPMDALRDKKLLRVVGRRRCSLAKVVTSAPRAGVYEGAESAVTGHTS
jgi:hypothetical protein